MHLHSFSILHSICTALSNELANGTVILHVCNLSSRLRPDSGS